MKTSDFLYDLPDDRIAQVPVEPRDAARLLVADTMEDRVFRDLPDLLDPGDLLVINRTRVRRARLIGRKVPTGGRVELLLLAPFGDGTWEALVRPARRLRAGTVIGIGGMVATLVDDPHEGVARIELEAGAGDLEEEIEDLGEMPLPPYIHARPADPQRYQTVYADRIGSAAAPTAGLHFTPEVLERIESIVANKPEPEPDWR